MWTVQAGLVTAMQKQVSTQVQRRIDSALDGVARQLKMALKDNDMPQVVQGVLDDVVSRVLPQTRWPYSSAPTDC